MTAIVDQFPPELFEEDPPTPPMLPSQGSTDSLASDAMLAPPPSAFGGSAKTNVLRELVETERKYVGDLEVMHVRSRSPFAVAPGSFVYRNTPKPSSSETSSRKTLSSNSFPISTNSSTSNDNF